MKKNKKLALFCIVCLIQIIIIFGGIISNEFIIKQGKTYKFKVRPIDPYDVFRGRYVRLYFDDTVYVKDIDIFESNQKVYAIIEEKEGFAEIIDIKKSKPDNKEYIKARVRYISSSGKISLKLPFDRYFLDEKYAKKAEIIARDGFMRRNDENEEAESVYAKVAILNGKTVVKDLCIGDKNIIDYIIEESKESRKD